MKKEWNWKPLGKVCKTSSGGTPLKSKKEYYEGGNIPWILSGEVAQGEIRNSKNFITPKGLECSSAKVFPVDTVLVAMYGATAGQVGILKFQAATNQAVCGIYPNEGFIPKFIFYLFLYQKKFLIAQAAGNAQPNISQAKIKQISVPLIPLPEQRRIVAILDEAFKGIEAASQTYTQKENRLDSFKQSLLNQTFSGGLGENVKKGWNWKPLGKVCKTGSGGTPLKSKKEYYEGGNIPWILSGEVAQGIIQNATNFITSKGLECSSARVFPEDTVLVAMYGATAGQVGILKFPAATNQAVCGIYPNESFNPKFIFYLFLYKKEFLISQAAGNAQPNISQVKIKKIPIPLITLPEQRRIVAVLDEAFEGVAEVSKSCQHNRRNLTDLKQSILHQAFTGQL